MRALRVSRASAGFLNRGHPWLRPDRFTTAPADLRCGELVQLCDSQGRELATALADPGAAILARVCGPAGASFDAVAATCAAWDRRGELHKDPDTDCYRIIHGEADGLPGLRVERFGSVIVLTARARCILPYLEKVEQTLSDLCPGAVLVEKLHLDDLRRSEVVSRRLDGSPLRIEDEIPAHELGCTLSVRPFDGLATGIYIDQRATRAWLRPQVAGARILNLFAYTGIFSTSLLAAGASWADDVDVSAPALAWGGRLAEANGVKDRRRVHRTDAREFLVRCASDWDLIICDPPTSAQGGSSWITKRDYPDLLTRAASRVAPGGMLVAMSNLLGRPMPLRDCLQSLPNMTLVESPPLGCDLPQRRGFPEGRPFQITVARQRTAMNSSAWQGEPPSAVQ